MKNWIRVLLVSVTVFTLGLSVGFSLGEREPMAPKAAPQRDEKLAARVAAIEGRVGYLEKALQEVATVGNKNSSSIEGLADASINNSKAINSLTSAMKKAWER